MNTPDLSSVFKLKASYAQQRLWFIDQLHGESQEYNIPKVIKFTGYLDMSALQQALDDVVSRHEILRTWFEFQDEQLYQLIIDDYSSKVEVEQASGPHDESIASFIEKTCRHSFTLTQLPLFKLSVLKLDDNQYMLAIVFHHIISDGWSSDIFMKELKFCYSSRLESLQPDLPPLTLQYADFAEWQKDQLEKQPDLYAKALAAQQQQLKNSETLTIASDHSRPKKLSNKGGLVVKKIGATELSALESMTTSLGVSAFTVLMAVWQVLLSRYSRQQHFAIGFPATCREVTELESLIGLFVNTAVVAADVDMNKTVRDHIKGVHEAILTALEYQSLPLELLVDRLAPERNLAIQPIFQVMMSYHKSNESTSDWAGGYVEMYPVFNNTSKFDLTLTVEHGQDDLTLMIEYSTDLFEHQTVENMVNSLSYLLKNMLTYESQRLAQCQMHSLAHEGELLNQPKWNKLGALPFDSLVEAFEYSVKCYPYRIAVSLKDTEVSYQALQQMVNSIAGGIVQTSLDNPIEPSIIAVCMSPSIELIATLIAIMKTGSAYMVLDPMQPKERLHYYINDADIKLIVYHQATQTLCQQLALNESFEMLSVEMALDNNDAVTPIKTTCHLDSLAYVIYTSGSTGAPKGVKIPHSNVLRLFSSTAQWFHFNEQDCWTLFHSTAFDFSVWEMWGALLYGGQLVVIDKETARDPNAFYQLVENQGVTVLNQTPSAFNNFISQDSKQRGNLSLRYVIFGGEAVDFDRLKYWYKRHDNQTPQLVNMYGITETTVHVTYMPLSAELVEDASASLIGEAIPDLDIYLLDEHENLVPNGMVGEIFVGGAGLAIGYLNRETLTNERFVTVKLATNDAQRLYKTGDLARLNSHGYLEYIGRCDSQVKIRGYRIETGEIEAVILSVLNIEDVKVVALSASDGAPKQLFAYLIGVAASIEQDVIRELLQNKLPDYMIPAAFLVLDEFPLTINGKLDIANLPLPQGLRPQLRNQYVPPHTEQQKMLSEIWQGVLSVNKVGIDDNFFALGGDSLRAVQATERAKKVGLSHSLIDLFEYQTISKLAVNLHHTDDSFQYVENACFSQISPDDRALIPDNIVDAYPLSAMQASMFYHMALSPDSNIYHCTGTTNFTIAEPFNGKAFYNAVQETVAAHDVYKTSFDFERYSEPLQLVHKVATLPTEIVDISHLSKAAQDEVIFALLDNEKKTPFDLSKPTLLRYFIHLRSSTSFQFTMTECHPVFDGWSYHSMIVEVFNRYACKIKAEPYAAMDQGSYRYADFVALEKRISQDDKQKEFWQSLLSDYTVTRLPRLNRQSDDAKIPELRLKRLTIAGEFYHKLKVLCQRAEVPMKSVALAAHIKVLSLVCGETDVLTGIPANGRPEDSAGDRLAGLFLNTLPFRFKLSPVSWERMVKDVFLEEMSMIPYRRYPFSSIQKDCGGQQIMDEVLFNYLDFHVYDELNGDLGLKASDPLEKEEVNEGTNFTLTVHFQHLTLTSNLQRNQVSVDIDYDANKLTVAQADMLELLYYEVLSEMAEAPEQLHSEVSFSQRIDRASVSLPVNLPTQVPIKPDLATFFGRLVTENPQAIAILEGKQLFTYEQINQAANRLAHCLIEKGVKRFDRIALMLPRSFRFIEAMLAVVKLGACYVPINPNDPIQRKEQLLTKANVSLLITNQEQSLSRNDDFSINVNTFIIDHQMDNKANYSSDDPMVTRAIEDTLYIMFTSGSTGEPKGVEVVQSNVLSLVKEQNYVNIDANSVLLHAAPVTFDASTFEIWGALLNGARLAIHTQQILTATSLQQLITEQWVNIGFFTTSLFNTLIDEDAAVMQGIEQALVGGEVISKQHVQACFDAIPDIELRNIYGPTETTTFALSYLIPCDFNALPASIPIGKPLNGVCAYVLDPYLLPVPLGTPGELYIGGSGVSQGYINNAGLTEQCFVTVEQITPQKLFKTGDKVRMLPCGNIEYIDRFDTQVKIRGFRVDLAEVESGLRSLEGVKDASTVVQGTGAEKRILAYWSPINVSKAPTNSVIREQFKLLMPSYMIPNHFYCLESLPLNSNGKVDKKKLNQLDLPLPSEASIIHPSSDNERKILSVWHQVLNNTHIGVDDHFFEVGGHSLLLTKVHRLLKGLGYNTLTLVDLLRCPSVRSLCLFLNKPNTEQLQNTLSVGKISRNQLNVLRKRRANNQRKTTDMGIK